MASRRRTREQFEDAESDGASSVEEPRLILQHKKKRARVTIQEPSKRSAKITRSSPGSDANSTDGDDGDDGNPELGHEPEPDNDMPSMTQYELFRDGDLNEQEENVEEDDQRCTQIIQARQTQAILAVNRVAEIGIVESIECINFMCHQRLKVKLGPLLNFVVGENGSGKSAVLTAITICLGGKASATNRGGSLKALIKEGQDTARLTVVLKNEGEGAYKPDLYGDKIVVERQFSRNGNPSFKLKSAMGRSISSKKADLDEITEYFALQVDNPLNILSQDNARQFLNASSASQKYNLWFQGVNLQALDQDYRIVQELLTNNEIKHRDFKGDLEALRKRKSETQRLVQVVRKNDGLREKLKFLRSKLIWAQVVEQERLLERYQGELEDIHAEIAEIETKIKTLETEHAVLLEKANKAKEAKEQAEREAQEFQSQIETAKEKYNDAKALQNTLHTEERNAKAAFDNLKRDLDAKDKAVKNEERRLEEVNGGKLAEQAENLKAAKEELKGLESQKTEIIETSQSMAQRISSAGNDVSEAQERLGRKDEDIKKCQQRINTLKKGSGDPYRPFNGRTRQLQAAIAQDQGFREKPVGPIGFHTHLSEPKWAPLIDKYLGGNLDAYVVTSHPDNVRLRTMMNSMGMNATIITTGKQPLNTSGREPPADIRTILRVLKFDNAVCRDPLVIGNSIEQVILMEDRRSAEDLIFRDDGTQPPNVKACLTFHDGQRGQGIMLSNSRDGVRSEPMKISASTARLRIAEASQLPVEEETLKALQADRTGLESSLERTKRALMALKVEKANLEQQIRSLDKEIRRKRTSIDVIQDKLASLEGDDNIQGLIEERNEAKGKWEVAGRQFGDVFAKKRDHENLVTEAAHEVKAKQEEQDEWDAIIAKAENKYVRLKDASDITLHRKNSVYQDLEEKRFRSERAEQKIQAQTEHIAQITEEAAGASSSRRVEIGPGETYVQIERMYAGITKQLDNLKRQQGKSDEEINQDYLHAKRQLQDAEIGSRNCRRDLDMLKRCLMQRAMQWRQFRRSISSYTRTQFEVLLSNRQFRGSARLDHKARRLVVEVEPDETRRDANGRSTKTLSGGEKSYSSICLLLSIWEAMGSPLRCLDEFDVFMDSINRSISTKLLIQAARASVGRQYIFITPNAIEGAQSQLGDDVKIHRLTDPRQKRVDHMMEDA